MLKAASKVVMRNVRYAKTPWQRMKGLMFEDQKKFNYALVFEFPTESKLGSSLHMLFVFFPIDVLFLNKGKVVVDKVTLTPFMPNYTPKEPAKFVVELPENKAKSIKVGQKISW